MNYLLAKVKRKNNLLRLLSTDDEIYLVPNDLNNSVDYNPATLIEEEEWYKFGGFSASQFITRFLVDDFDSVNHNQISIEEARKIAYLCAVQGDLYLFQTVSSSQLIRKKWLSLDEFSIEADRPIVTLNTYPDVIYHRGNDTLYFKKLSSANSIFKDMDQLYRQATDLETQAFLQNDFIETINGFDASSVKIPNRKRIAMVIDTLNAYTPQQRSDIFSYIQGYCDVPYQNDKFEIENEDHLKLVLYGIEQRFYTTQLGNEKRIANSIITIP